MLAFGVNGHLGSVYFLCQRQDCDNADAPDQFQTVTHFGAIHLYQVLLKCL